MIGIATQFTSFFRAAPVGRAMPLSGLLGGRSVRLISSATIPLLNESSELGRLELPKPLNEVGFSKEYLEKEDREDREFWAWMKERGIIPLTAAEAFERNPDAPYFADERAKRDARLQAEKLQAPSSSDRSVKN